MKYLYILIIACLVGVIIERNTISPTTSEMGATAKNYSVTHNKPIPPKIFKQDGCTLFPDKIFSSDFSKACFDHDVVYWYGGTKEEKEIADQNLKKTVAESGFFGFILQEPIYLGVHAFGDTWLTKFFDANWGFGWNK